MKNLVNLIYNLEDSKLPSIPNSIINFHDNDLKTLDIYVIMILINYFRLDYFQMILNN